jgi:hypothetical protein
MTFDDRCSMGPDFLTTLHDNFFFPPLLDVAFISEYVMA